MNDSADGSFGIMPLVIVGAGGHGREVFDVVRSINTVEPTWKVRGFVADGGGDLDEIAALSVPYLGSINQLETGGTDATKTRTTAAAMRFVIAIGSGAVRRSIDERLTRAGWLAATVVHPSATLGARCELGPGTVIAAGVRLTTNVRLGRHVHVNLNSTVSHDSVLGNFVTLSPGVNVTGHVTLEDGVECGTGAAILPGVRVGHDTRIGAGAVVTKDCPPGCTMVGVPARPLADTAHPDCC